MNNNSTINFLDCAQQLKTWGQELGFQQIGITDTNLDEHRKHLASWIKRGYHGEMDFMTKHGSKRTHPEQLIPGTIRIIVARMNYLPPASDIKPVLQDGNLAAISRYALGRDYHKLIRKRLTNLAQRLEQQIGPYNYRAFADSGPVLERALATKAGLGWFGKHSILLNKTAGSYFFLGTIYTDLPLPIDQELSSHCGTCSACITSCPTNAIVANKVIDANKCISYLTIEYKGVIGKHFLEAIGNRIFGCDDCQVVCPWNKFAQVTTEPDFYPRYNLAEPKLLDLFNWNEQEFLKKTEGSAIRRVGYACWLRNICIAIGNAPYSEKNISALKEKLNFPSTVVQTHSKWAIEQQLLTKSMSC